MEPQKAPKSNCDPEKFATITLPNIKLYNKAQKSKQHGTGIKTDT